MRLAEKHDANQRVYVCACAMCVRLYLSLSSSCMWVSVRGEVKVDMDGEPVD